MDHLGVEVDSSEASEAATLRLGATGCETDVEQVGTGCYVLQEGPGATGPARTLGRSTPAEPMPTSMTKQISP